MNLMTLDNISKSYGEKILIDEISLAINEGDKIGLIGINGTGKSTLLKIIAGIEEADKGNISSKRGIRVEYLAQDLDFDFDATVIEQVYKANSEEINLLRDYQETIDKITKGEEGLDTKLLEIQSKIDGLNLWNLESEIKTILTKLDINNFDAKVGTLSGGQRKRIAMAAALIAPSDILILDEPTNHMDSDTIAWLEEYLNSRNGALFMITHDRYFLDRVTNRIIELDGGNLYSYEGNYSVFVEKKIERQELDACIQKKKQNLFKKELAWIRTQPRARGTKQKARIEKFNELKHSLVNIKDEQLDISVQGSRLGNKIIEMDMISKSFGDNTIINNFSYILLRDDRIGIVGPNGAGKTTLMRIISGDLNADTGLIERGETVKIGYFSQENYHLDEDMRVLEYVKEIGEYLPLSNGERISASKMLERFLFPTNSHSNKIGNLSGGEKRRLYLLCVLMSAPNVLILDEPTNDLDIATLTILEDFIDGFNGPVLCVSHDRYFLDRICNKVFAYIGGGQIEFNTGNYSDYINKLGEVQKPKPEDKKEKVKKENTKVREKKVKFTYKEKIEYEEIDDVIENLEKDIQRIDEEMEKNADQYSLVMELLEQKQEIESNLEEKYDRYVYLNELAELIEKQRTK